MSMSWDYLCFSSSICFCLQNKTIVECSVIKDKMIYTIGGTKEMLNKLLNPNQINQPFEKHWNYTFDTRPDGVTKKESVGFSSSVSQICLFLVRVFISFLDIGVYSCITSSLLVIILLMLSGIFLSCCLHLPLHSMCVHAQCLLWDNSSVSYILFCGSSFSIHDHLEMLNLSPFSPFLDYLASFNVHLQLWFFDCKLEVDLNSNM